MYNSFQIDVKIDASLSFSRAFSLQFRHNLEIGGIGHLAFILAGLFVKFLAGLEVSGSL